jgi:hypothetical protein
LGGRPDFAVLHYDQFTIVRFAHIDAVVKALSNVQEDCLGFQRREMILSELSGAYLENKE